MTFRKLAWKLVADQYEIKGETASHECMDDFITKTCELLDSLRMSETVKGTEIDCIAYNIAISDAQRLIRGQ